MSSGEVIDPSTFVSERLPLGWRSSPVEVSGVVQEVLDRINSPDIKLTPALSHATEKLLGIIDDPEGANNYDVLSWQTKYNIPEDLLLNADNPETKMFACDNCQGATQQLCEDFLVGYVVGEEVIKEQISSDELLGKMAMQEIALASHRTNLTHSLRIAGCKLDPDQIDHNITVVRSLSGN